MSKLGIDAVLAYNSGTWSSPTWVPITCIGDCAVNPGWSEAGVITRASLVEMAEKTTAKVEVTGKILSTAGDTGYEKILKALVGKTKLDMLILNGPIATEGSTGWRGYFQVFSGNEGQNPGDVVMPDISIKPTVPPDGNYLKFASVGSSGTLTYTAPGTEPSLS